MQGYPESSIYLMRFTPNLHSWLTPKLTPIINPRWLSSLIMCAPIILGHIDAPTYEKPRLFSHWKPSLAQVAFNVHSPATLRVRALQP
jgi:hypothetical protein